MGYGQTYTKKAIIAICGMLAFGTGTMVTSKIMLDLKACWPANDFIQGVTRGHGCEVTRAFEKPWFQTAVMFFGMAMCTLLFLLLHSLKKREYEKQRRERPDLFEIQDEGHEESDLTSRDDRAISGPDDTAANAVNENLRRDIEKAEKLRKDAAFIFNTKDQWKDYGKVAIPACFDMIATCVMTYGLVFIDVSIMQMLRGSMVVFSTLFGICFFKRHVHAYQWIAVCMVILACVLVGVACIMGSAGNTTSRSAADQLFGCVLVVISQLVQAGQIVVESFLLDEVELPALIIVGFEGVWGFVVTVIMLIVAQFIPGGDDGSMENTASSFFMLGDNPSIIGATVVYWFCITFLNWSGMTCTQELGPVVRTIWEAVRTAAIWVVDLFIYYVVVPNSVYGESWNSWSILQLCGFSLLVWGSMVNNAMVKYPGLYYPPAVYVGKKRPNKDVVEDYVNKRFRRDEGGADVRISA